MNHLFPSLRTQLATLLACLFLLSSAQAGLSAGISSNGKEIAERWCANCHAVADEQSSASADVPSFRELARKYEDNLEGLGNFLIDPHPIMPNFSLSRNEIKDLVAYIDSLKE